MIRSLIAGALGAVIASAIPAAAAEMVPHQARFSVEVPALAMLGEIRGTAELEFRRTCGEWVSSLTMEIQIPDPGGKGTERRFRSFAKSRQEVTEALDGRHYRFKLETANEGFLSVRAGQARLGEKGEKSEAVFELPMPSFRPLDENTLFPVSLTRAMVAAAEAGQRHVTSPYFDGTEENETVMFTIGDAVRAEKTVVKGDVDLLDRPGWDTTMSFSRRSSRQSLTQARYILLDNGITARMHVRGGEVDFIYKLEEIHRLPMPRC